MMQFRRFLLLAVLACTASLFFPFAIVTPVAARATAPISTSTTDLKGLAGALHHDESAPDAISAVLQQQVAAPEYAELQQAQQFADSAVMSHEALGNNMDAPRRARNVASTHVDSANHVVIDSLAWDHNTSADSALDFASDMRRQTTSVTGVCVLEAQCPTQSSVESLTAVATVALCKAEMALAVLANKKTTLPKPPTVSFPNLQGDDSKYRARWSVPSKSVDLGNGAKAVQIAAGSAHVCVILASNGGVKCWGANWRVCVCVRVCVCIYTYIYGERENVLGCVHAFRGSGSTPGMVGGPNRHGSLQSFSARKRTSGKT